MAQVSNIYVFTASCKPLSYDTCAEFAVEFDRLYNGRNTDKYPLNNPMLQDPSVSVHNQVNTKDIFDRIQFPIRYNFIQDPNTGAVTREFGNTDPPTGTKYFRLVNQESGKVLGLSGNSCDDETYTEAQNYVRNSHYQQFSLTDDGRLKNRGCTGNDRLLHNAWHPNGADATCRHGNPLAIRNPVAMSVADLQSWTFHKDGSIVNKRCKFL